MAYPAIRTKFLGATNTKGSRIKATVETPPEFGRGWPILDKQGVKFFTNVTLPYDYELDQFSNHQRVAKALAFRFFNTYVTQEEPIELVAGEVDRGYVWVRVSPNLVQLS
jgi:hypothetical protein